MYTSSLLFLVGGGASPLYPPNKVIVWVDARGRAVADLEFWERVRGLAARRGWLVVALRRRAVAFEIGKEVKRVMEWDTCDNQRGLVAIATATHSTLLAIAGRQTGHVQLIHLPPCRPPAPTPNASSPPRRAPPKPVKRPASIIAAHTSALTTLTTTSSMVSVFSSTSTVDSEDFSELDSMSGDGSLYGTYGYANDGCSSVREVEMADYADFDMSESKGSQGQRQTLSLPPNLSMPLLGGASGSGAGSMSINTRIALASFSLESSPVTTSYLHSHHGHSHSAQISSQTAQNLMPGPLSFVIPQSRRSTSASGAPTTPPIQMRVRRLTHLRRVMVGKRSKELSMAE